ncbi:3-oxoadipate enol-lactonase [Actinocorallia longicatena]|uniref:3-oxoadipate enol-lactonase n=2 Tax=Actinocorallia longicatena TaxID=111803 RepID=A0ABP6QMH1_9ACTN
MLAHELHGPEDGARVVLLGGIGMPRLVWHMTQLPALLAAGHRVALVDLRGSGDSPATEDRCAVSDLAAEVVEVLDGLGWERAAFVGVSLGGLVSEELAATRPERVSAAVLIASAGPVTVYVRAWAEAIAGLLEANAGGLGRFFVAENLAYALPAKRLQEDDAAVQGWVDLLTSLDWDSAGPRGQYRAWIAWSLAAAHPARWPSIRVPVLVCSLEHDLLFPPAGGRKAAAAIPGARFAEIPGHAHNGVIEATPLLDPPIMEFLGSVL